MKKFKMEEILLMDNVKKYTITFKSTKKFYIGEQTLNSFIRKIKELDPDLIQLPNGDLNNMRIIHIRSSKLTRPDVNSVSNNFLQRYDFLRISTVVQSI